MYIYGLSLCSVSYSGRWLFVFSELRWVMMVCVQWVTVGNDCLCSVSYDEWWLFVFSELRWAMIVCVQWVTVSVDCLCSVSYGERWLFVFSELRWAMIVCFAGIGGIVDKHCLNIFAITLKKKITFKEILLIFFRTDEQNKPESLSFYVLYFQSNNSKYMWGF
jgi:hypothetical protein